MGLGRPELGSAEVVDHGTTATGRWLRARRIRIAVWIALIEGLLVVVHAIPWGVALVVAILLVVGYLWGRDRLGGDAARQVGWIAATSQALVAIVPVLVLVAGFLAILVVALLAIAALLALLGDRR